MDDSAIVLLSGGQDSATCLSWACQTYDTLYAVTFNYGQRHVREIECSKKLCKLANVKKHIIIDIQDFFSQIGASNNAMIDDKLNVNDKHLIFKTLPSTFVPFRNLFLLSSAASIGLQFGITTIVTGICQTDYSGYYDCRESFKKSLETTLSESINLKFDIQSPLMYKTKTDTVQLMDKLGTLNWYKHTHTCYNGTAIACGKCPSCKLRLKGFKEAGIKDLIDYQNEI